MVVAGEELEGTGSSELFDDMADKVELKYFDCLSVAA